MKTNYVEEKSEHVIKIKPLIRQRIKVRIIGITPYMPEPIDMAVVENLDKKKSNQMASDDKRSEEEKVKHKFYFTHDGLYGVPVSALFKSFKSGSMYVIDKTDGGMKRFMRACNFLGDIIPLEYERIEIDRRPGRDSGRNRAPRLIVRNAFVNWSCVLEIEFNPALISPELIVNIGEHAGFHIGIGGFRGDCNGNCGLFRVATA